MTASAVKPILTQCTLSLVALCISAHAAAEPRSPGTIGRAWNPGGERTSIDGIRFDSTIACGNGHGFQRVGPDHYRFRARAGLEPYAWRFYFKIECPKAAGRRITIEVADFNHAGRTAFHEGATVWSTDNRHWQTLPADRIAIVPHTPTGCAEIDSHYGDRSHVPYGVRYRLELAAPEVWFAVPTPYTLRHRDEVLERVAAAQPELVRLVTFGLTTHAGAHRHAIRGATIAAPGLGLARRNVVVIAGEHPAETAGMYACEGWMEETLSHPDWLARYAFHFVPVVNVDGVHYGASYFNLPENLVRGVGENISTAWRARRLPEVRSLWPWLAGWRPAFFASLHNGRHRTAMEALGPAGPGTDALIASWRRELGVALERVVPRAGDRAWNVLSESGLTSLAYTIETLLLVRQAGCASFEASYRLTGRQLARGTVAALDSLRAAPVPRRSATPQDRAAKGSPAATGTTDDGARFPCVRLAASDFAAQLPWFYHGLAFERRQAHDIFSLEANALDLPAGEHAVALLPAGEPASIAVSLDGTRFTEIPVRDGRAELARVAITNRMLSLFIKGNAAGTVLPLQSVLIRPPDTPFAGGSALAVPFTRYRRDIRLGEREILERDAWDEFHALLRHEGFGKQDLRAMFNELLAWCARRQVLDPADPHHGAIYSEEDKYDFRDAAAAAVCFTHAWRNSGDIEWRRRALAARAYALKGQHIEDPANRDQYGGFCQMVDGLWGTSFRRLRGSLPAVTGVETCIIIHLLARTFELGLDPAQDDLRRVDLAARWVAANEFRPGVFRHHQGATHDCQNSNVLGAMALARAHETLDKRGWRPPRAWLDAARRGLRHYLEGQETIGCWPYVFAGIGRGQAYREHNIPDQGMGVYHLMIACDTPALRDEPDLKDRLARAARWWLCMSRVDRGAPAPTIDLDDRQASGTLKFSAFTWCRFMAAAALLRIAKRTGETEPWRSLALRYMEHVRSKLWNRTDPARAPVRRATRPDMRLCSWIQAAEWDAALLRDMEEHLP